MKYCQPLFILSRIICKLSRRRGLEYTACNSFIEEIAPKWDVLKY